MRNDYPKHPAGPLDYHEDPNEVVEVRQSAINAWISILCGVALLSLLPIMMMTRTKVAKVGAAEGAPPPKPMPTFFLVVVPVGILFIAGGYYVLKHSSPVIVVRPDGLEFPAEGMPPLRWDQIQSVDISTLVLIGAGGPQDYLGIKLRPGVLPDGPSPYSTLIMKAARAMAGWDFDVCISQNSVNICPAHLAMIMRIRLENAQRLGANPPPPPGLEHLDGAIRPQNPGEAPRLKKPQTVPRAGLRMGCAALMVFFGGCGALPGVMIATGMADGKPPPRKDGSRGLSEEEFRRAMQNSMAFGLMLVVVGGIFVWPWPDDEDEES